MINGRIRDLAKDCDLDWHRHWNDDNSNRLEKFAELIKQAIYDEVKEELVEDKLINRHRDSLVREYLKGCNGGIVDALTHIKNFGKDIEE